MLLKTNVNLTDVNLTVLLAANVNLTVLLKTNVNLTVLLENRCEFNQDTEKQM